MLRRSRRGATHGNLAARLHALEVAAAARHGGPFVGIEDAATGEIRADGGRTYATPAEFFAAGRRGDKLPLLIVVDRDPSPHNRPHETPEGGPQ